MSAPLGMLDQIPQRVSITEVALRDGLQNEAIMVSLADKRALFTSIVP